MSSRRDSYEVFSDCLGIPEEMIRQSFYKSANKQGFIAQNQLQDIADEIKSTQPDAYQRLSFLLSTVKEYIVSQGYDPAAISYKDLLEMVVQALRFPAISESELLPSEREHYPEAKEVQLSQSEVSQKDLFGISGIQWPKNYKNNKEKLDGLLKNHRDELYIKFKDRETVQGSGRINVQGYYTFLQECVFIGSLAIMAHEEDIRNFFQLGDSYNRLCKVVDAYFIKNQEKGTDSQVFANVTLTFLQCFDILDNWFKIDHNVKIYDDKEQQSTIEGLLITISKYQTMLSNAQNNIEKQALKNTILSLYDKIENLSKSREKKDAERSPRSYNEVREERRIRALRDIFDFFCRKGLKIAKGFTFESINRHYSGMTLEKFSVMLKDFNIKIDQFRLIEYFNRVKQGLEVLSFDDFEFILKKVALEAELVTEIKEYKFDRSIMKNYKPDTYKQSPVPKKERSDSHSSKKDNPSKLQNEQEKIEALWNYMGLYDDSYKRAFTGLRSNLSVVPSEKSTLATEQDQVSGSRHKTVQGDEPLTERRKEVAKNLKEVRFRQAPGRRDLVPSMVYRSERASANIKAKGKHLCLKPEELGPVTRSLTMQQAEHLNDNDIKRIDKEFHPLSLISQNNDDDEVYLAEYDLRNPKNPQSEKASNKTKLPMLYKIPPSLRRYSQMHNQKTQRQDSKKRDQSFNQDAEDGRSSGKGSEINSRNDVQAIHEMMKDHELNQRGERKSVPVTSKQRSISSDVLDRANQVQEYLKNRQLRMIDNILNIQAIMHDRGFKTAWK